MADKYKYLAVSREGVRSNGIIEAESESKAGSAISSSGLIPIKLSKISYSGIGLRSLFKQKVNSENLAIFTRKLLTLNRAGIPILRSLDIIISDIEDNKLLSVLQDVRNSIEGGSNLTEAFEKHSDYFPDLYISTIRAGEESGTLDIMLSRASELIEREMKIKDGVKTAIRYPSYVVLTICLAFAVVITLVIPKFSGFYSSYGAELPWATRLLIDINRLLTQYWPFLLITSPILIAGLWRFRQTRWGTRIIDYIVINIPIVGNLIIKTILARFCYILATLLSAGLPLARSLEVLKVSIGNIYFSKVIAEMGENLSGGADIIAPMRSFKYFSPMTVQMFSIGLESGSLESILLEIARHYDIEIERDTKKLTSRIEPLLTILIGIAVLILALAIFLPMWNMISVFKK